MATETAVKITKAPEKVRTGNGGVLREYGKAAASLAIGQGFATTLDTARAGSFVGAVSGATGMEFSTRGINGTIWIVRTA